MKKDSEKKRLLNYELFLVIIIALALFTGYFFGFFIGLNQLDPNQPLRNVDGLYLKGWNETAVKSYTKKVDPPGDWICVNVREMSFERALQVCQHETGHEIFAEICEKNITKCIEGVK